MHTIQKSVLICLCWCLLCIPSNSLSAQSTVKANLTYYKGISSLKRGNMGNAVRQFKRVLRENPKHNAACLALIKLHLAAGQEQKAARMLEHLANTNSDRTQLEHNYYLAHLNILLERHDAARSYLEQLIRNAYDVENPNFSVLARCYNAMGYLNVIQNQNRKSEGYVLTHANVLERSRIMFEEALKYNTQNASAFTNYNKVNQLLDMSPNMISPYQPNQFETRGIDESLQEAAATTDIIYNEDLLPEEMGSLLEQAEHYDELLLMIDVSGSMRVPLKQGVERTRFDVMKNLTCYLLDKMEDKTRMGVVSVGGDCGNQPSLRRKVERNNRSELATAINNVRVDGHTPINDAILIVPELFRNKKNKKGIILITDGMESCDPNETCRLAAWLGSENITLHVLSFLEEKVHPEEYSSYTCMAATTGGTLSSMNADDTIQESDYQFINEEQLLLPPLKIDTTLQVRSSVAGL